MPFPLKPGYSLQYRPRLLMEFPEHAARIGLISAEWTALENELAHTVAFSLFAFSSSERGAQKITTTVLGAIDSLAARLDMIEAILKPRIPEDWYLRFVNDIKPELRRRARERNRIVHGHWQACSKYPKDLILGTFDEDPMRYTTNCLDDIADRINQTLNSVATYLMNLQQIVGPTLPPFPLLSSPPPKDTPPQSD